MRLLSSFYANANISPYMEKFPRVVYFVGDKNTLIKKAVTVHGILRQRSVSHPAGNIFSGAPERKREDEWKFSCLCHTLLLHSV